MKFWKKIGKFIKDMESWYLGYFLGVGMVILEKLSFWGGIFTMVIAGLLLYLRVLRVFGEKK